MSILEVLREVNVSLLLKLNCKFTLDYCISTKLRGISVMLDMLFSVDINDSLKTKLKKSRDRSLFH